MKVKDEDVVQAGKVPELVRLGVEILGQAALGAQLSFVKLVERALQQAVTSFYMYHHQLRMAEIVRDADISRISGKKRKQIMFCFIYFFATITRPNRRRNSVQKGGKALIISVSLFFVTCNSFWFCANHHRHIGSSHSVDIELVPESRRFLI